VKRTELEQHLRKHACALHREGARHSVWWNSEKRKTSSVPRHREIKTPTVWAICRQLEIPKPSGR